MTEHRRLASAPIAALLIVLASAVASAQAGPVRSATGASSATIVSPLSFTPGAQLAFGLVKTNGSSGTVTVKPEAVRSAAGGAVIVGSGPCHLEFCEDDTHTSASDSASYWGPGLFDVRGTPGATYRVALPVSVQATFRSPAKGRIPVLTAHQFRVVARSTGLPQGQLDGAGRDSFRVGGTLIVSPDVKGASSYRVNLPIQIDYP